MPRTAAGVGRSARRSGGVTRRERRYGHAALTLELPSTGENRGRSQARQIGVAVGRR